MSRAWMGAFTALALLGCGRLGFDATAELDAAVADGPKPDAGANDDIALRVKFEGDGFDFAGGRTPTCIGCPLQFTDSPSGLGQALWLTGTECLEYADDPALRPVAFTLSAWLRTDQLRVASILGKAFDAQTTEENSYEFWLSNIGQVHFSTINGPNPYVLYGNIAPMTWYHVAGTFDGVRKRIYVDGVERDALDVAVTSYDAEPFRIGCDRGNGQLANFFIGALDDVRLYRRALAPAEVATLASQLP